MVKIILTDLMTGKAYEIPEDKNDIKMGRNRENNYIALPDRGYLESLDDASKKNYFLELAKRISREHAIIRKKGNGIVIIDTKSKNGVYLNGRRIEPEKEYALKNGAKVNLGGNYNLELVIEEFEEETKVIKKTKTTKGDGGDNEFEINEGDFGTEKL